MEKPVMSRKIIDPTNIGKTNEIDQKESELEQKQPHVTTTSAAEALVTRMKSEALAGDLPHRRRSFADLVSVMNDGRKEKDSRRLSFKDVGISSGESRSHSPYGSSPSSPGTAHADRKRTSRKSLMQLIDPSKVETPYVNKSGILEVSLQRKSKRSASRERQDILRRKSDFVENTAIFKSHPQTAFVAAHSADSPNKPHAKVLSKATDALIDYIKPRKHSLGEAATRATRIKDKELVAIGERRRNSVGSVISAGASVRTGERPSINSTGLINPDRRPSIVSSAAPTVNSLPQTVISNFTNNTLIISDAGSKKSKATSITSKKTPESGQIGNQRNERNLNINNNTTSEDTSSGSNNMRSYSCYRFW